MSANVSLQVFFKMDRVAEVNRDKICAPGDLQ
jgi:hypothetical protein